MSEIVKNKLYLGNMIDINNINFIQEKNITSIICIVDNIIIKPVINIATQIHKYNLYELLTKDVKIYINEITNIIQNNNCTLVVCENGLSSSPAFIIAYLMNYYDMFLLDAYRYVFFKRKSVYIDVSLLYRLYEYEYDIFGKNFSKFDDFLQIIIKMF